MNIWNILTADVRLNPIVLRHYFSRVRFAREDVRVRGLPILALPEIIGAPPAGGQGPVLFAVADLGYFTRFANMFASSAAINSPQSAVHIHVIGADENAVLPAIDRLPKHYVMTFESADFSKMPGPLKGRYCQCLRFARMAQFVKQSGRDYVAFDIDGLFQKSFANFCDDFVGDVGLIVRPEFSDAGLRVNAGVVYMRATSVAQNFMDHASAHMLQHLQHAPFIEKLDQRCLAMAIDETVKPLPPDLYTFEPGQGHFYSAKGSAKNEVLRRVFEQSMVNNKN
jgi:Nucleotide-diphospho-sugar transferase